MSALNLSQIEHVEAILSQMNEDDVLDRLQVIEFAKTIKHLPYRTWEKHVNMRLVEYLFHKETWSSY